MRTGVRLAIDVGKARIGVARSDPMGSMAVPLETVRRANAGESDVERIRSLCDEYNAVEAYVGLPLNLQGQRTPSTEDAEQFAERLAGCLPVQVRLVDERLSTVSAQGQLQQAGKNTKQSRSIIDQAAAVVILQHVLDSERASGMAPGKIVGEEVSSE